MPDASLTYNTSLLRRVYALCKWPYWFVPVILVLGLTSLIVLLACPNPIGTAIATSLLLSIIVTLLCSLCTLCSVLCILTISEAIEAFNTPNQNQDSDQLPTYEEIRQEDEKQLPSYEEACRIERKQLANLRMSTPQSLTTERTCLISTTPPPPYGTFFEEAESCKQILSHIEATIDLSQPNQKTQLNTNLVVKTPNRLTKTTFNLNTSTANSATNTWLAEEVRLTYSPA